MTPLVEFIMSYDWIQYVLSILPFLIIAWCIRKYER